MVEGNKPIAKVTVGKVQVTAWENKTPTGKMYTASIKNSYYDEKTKEWKDTTSYSLTQLLELKEAVSEIYRTVRVKIGEKQDDKE